jgi:hypothetical protein
MTCCNHRIIFGCLDFMFILIHIIFFARRPNILWFWMPDWIQNFSVIIVCKAMPSPRQFIGFLLPSLRFNPSWIHVRFILDEVVLDLHSFPLLIIIPSLLHTHLSLTLEVCDRHDQMAHYHIFIPNLGTKNGTYIYHLHNNLFIQTTCFDPNGASSDAFIYTSLVIELQCNIRTFTLTYMGHNRFLSFFFYTFGDVTHC